MIVGIAAVVGIMVVIGGIMAFVIEKIEDGGATKTQRDHLSVALNEQVQANKDDRAIAATQLRNITVENAGLVAEVSITQSAVNRAKARAEAAEVELAQSGADKQEVVICPVNCKVDWE